MLKKSILAVLLLLSLLNGCGSGLTPEEVINRAIEAINELQTYRYESSNTVTMGEITVHGNLQGEFVSPDKLHLICVSDGETEEGIRIGTAEYIWQSDIDCWEAHEWPLTMTFVSTNWAAAVSELLNPPLLELLELPDEKIDGVSCFHYEGSIDMETQVDEQIANLDPSQPFYEERLKLYEQILQSEQNVEFWVGKKDYLLRRWEARIVTVYTDDTEGEASTYSTSSFRLFDFNQSITIEPPIVD